MKTHASVLNPNFRYAKAEQMTPDYLRKKFAKIKRELAKSQPKQIEYFRTDELADSRKPMPPAFDWIPNKTASDRSLMDQDYEQMGDPFHPFHMRRIG